MKEDNFNTIILIFSVIILLFSSTFEVHTQCYESPFYNTNSFDPPDIQVVISQIDEGRYELAFANLKKHRLMEFNETKKKFLSDFMCELLLEIMQGKLDENDLSNCICYYKEYRNFCSSNTEINNIFPEIYRAYYDELILQGNVSLAKNILDELYDLFPAERQSDRIRFENFLECPNTIKKNMGKSINSKYDEYAPVISNDGITLYFIRDDRDQHLKNSIDYIFTSGEDIYKSEIKSEFEHHGLNSSDDSKWKKAFKNSSLSTMKDEAMLALTNNSTEAYVFKQGRIWKAYLQEDGSWDNFEKLEDPFGDYWCGGLTFSPDGKYLIFCSLRENTTKYSTDSTKDLYICERLSETEWKWSEPINLGPVINTKFNERSPFFAADNKTLYFSSSGHPGLGNLDVFKTVMGNSLTEWSTPKNMGAKINTFGNDWFFKLTASGRNAYYVSTGSNSFGGSDLYELSITDSVCLPEGIRAVISGFVRNQDGKGVKAKLILVDIQRKDTLKVFSSQNNGKYYQEVPFGNFLKLFAVPNNKSCFSESIDVNLTDIEKLIFDNGFYKYEGDIQISCITKPDVEIIDNTVVDKPVIELPDLKVYFDFASAEMTNDSDFEITRLADFLIANQDIKIKLIGHADKQGEHHKHWSLKRANAVKKALVKKGVKSSRITTIGMGKKKPKCFEETEECFRINRRVEYEIY